MPNPSDPSWLNRFLLHERKDPVRYFAAIGFAALGLVMVMVLPSQDVELISDFGLLASILSALYGGAGPGIVTAVISSLALDYFFIPPLYSTFIDASAFFRLALFVIISVFASQFSARIRTLIGQLEQARKQESEAKENRQHILNIVAHDLKNPLSAIWVAVSVLRKLESEPLAGTRKRLFDQIELSKARMERMIQDLLDTAKIDSGHFTVKKSATTARNMFNELKMIFEARALEKGVPLEFRDGTQGLEFLCDHAQMLRVLGNLLSNAVKFSPRGRTVVVEASCARAFITFAVTDFGPGISEENRAHLFQRHWQAPATAHQGSGLGLYISRGIVSAHDGKIELESRPGEGACFTVFLPIIPPHDQLEIAG
jgi:K+-sensing histidine kinase KdpD